MSNGMDAFRNAYNRATSYLSFINEILENIKINRPNPEFIKDAFEKFCTFVNAEKGLLLMLKPNIAERLFKEFIPDFSVAFNTELNIPVNGLPVEKVIWFGPKANLKIASPDIEKQKKMDDFIFSIDKSIQSYIWLPVILHQEMVGVVILFNLKSKKGFSSFEVEAYIGINIIGTFTGYQISKDFEHQTSIQMMKIAIEALEGRSLYLKGHVDRVVDISNKLAIRLKLSRDEQKDLEIAATMHDIGITKFNECILLKPMYVGAKLTRDERIEYESHPAEGIKLLAQISGVNKNIKETILYHHERIDGSGYPGRLKGDEIPILARIIGTYVLLIGFYIN